MPRTKVTSRSCWSAEAEAPGSGRNRSRSPSAIGSQTRLRSRTWAKLKTTLARRASRSERHAMQRWARYPLPSAFSWMNHWSPNTASTAKEASRAWDGVKARIWSGRIPPGPPAAKRSRRPSAIASMPPSSCTTKPRVGRRADQGQGELEEIRRDHTAQALRSRSRGRSRSAAAPGRSRCWRTGSTPPRPPDRWPGERPGPSPPGEPAGTPPPAATRPSAGTARRWTGSRRGPRPARRS